MSCKSKKRTGNSNSGVGSRTLTRRQQACRLSLREALWKQVAAEGPVSHRLQQGEALQAVLFPKPSQEPRSHGAQWEGTGSGVSSESPHLSEISCLKSQVEVIQEGTFLSVMRSQNFVFAVLDTTLTSIKI